MTEFIQPFYVTNYANETIQLGIGDIDLISPDGHVHRGSACVELRLSPKCLLIFKVQLPPSPAVMFDLGTSRSVRFRYGDMSKDEDAIVLRSHITVGQVPKTELELIPKRGKVIFCSDRNERLNQVFLHILNFPEFFSFGTNPENLIHIDIGKNGRTQSLLGRTLLVSPPWQIEIQALPSTNKLIKQLKAEGGYAITHVARLSRISGKTFLATESDQILFQLRQFLSFARGHWTPTFGVVGINSSAATAFTDWGMTLSTPWEGRNSWFDEQNGHCLKELFDGFRGLLHDKSHVTAISHALYWYLRSNRAGEGAGVDSGVILSQAALERLADVCISKNNLSSRGNAAIRIRRAAQHLGIPIKVPSISGRLYRAGKAGAWNDSPEAITRIRNELVHPQGRLPIDISKVVVEGWNLAQWYVELFILKMSGYSGVYSNRIRPGWAGQVENVP